MAFAPEDSDVLIELLHQMTEGHVSTIVGSLDRPGSRIGTSTSSPNCQFLRKLCELDLAEELPLEVDLPPEILSKLTSFTIRDDAKPEIAALIRSVLIDNQREAEIGPDPEGGQ